MSTLTHWRRHARGVGRDLGLSRVPQWGWIVLGVLGGAFAWTRLASGSKPSPSPSPVAPPQPSGLAVGACVTIDLATVDGFAAQGDADHSSPINLVNRARTRFVCGRVLDFQNITIFQSSSLDPSHQTVAVISLSHPLPEASGPSPGGGNFAVSSLSTLNVPQQGIVGACQDCP